MNMLRALAVSTLVLWGVCYADQDRVVRIRTDGTLSEIPAQFGPSMLRVRFSKSSERPISSLELTLGTQTNRLPTCVTRFLPAVRLEDIGASGSWNHDETRLPYYVTVRFFDSGYDGKSSDRPGYALHFNLRTARLIKMQVIVVSNRGKDVWVHLVPVDLALICSPSELPELKGVPK